MSDEPASSDDSIGNTDYGTNDGSGGYGDSVTDNGSGAGIGVDTNIGFGMNISSSTNSDTGKNPDSIVNYTANGDTADIGTNNDTNSGSTDTLNVPIQTPSPEAVNAPIPAPSDVSAQTPATPQGTPDETSDAEIENGPNRGTGTYTIDYDGTGPFIVRIDVPMETFREMYFDGAIWTPGTDYEVQSGSTILTIPETRLESVSEGSHKIRAVFESQSVQIEFIMQKTSAKETLSPIFESSSVTVLATEKSFPFVQLIGLVLAAGAVAVFGTRVFRQRKATVK
jgi:hypothetical protein